MRRAAALLALAAAVLGLLWFARETEPRGASETPPRVSEAADAPPTALVEARPLQGGRSEMQTAAEKIEPTVTQEIHVYRFLDARTTEPVPGVRVRLTWMGDPEEALFEGVTGEDGVARAEITSVLPTGGKLVGSIVEEGLVPHRAFVGNDGRIALRVEAGFGLMGRVVDADGNGVQARVSFRHARGGKDVPKLAYGWNDPDGAFMISVPASGVPEGVSVLRGRVFAKARGAGTGALPEAAWVLDDLPRDLEIVVRGGGVRGRVVDGVGRPCAALPLRVRHAGYYARKRDLPADLLAELREDRFFEADGCVDVAVTTDADGWFRAAGLRTGDVRVFVAEEEARWSDRWPWPELTAQPASTDEALALVYDRPRLEVRLLGADGTPWAGAVHVDDRSDNALRSRRDATAYVRVVPARSHHGRLVPATDDPKDIVAGLESAGGACRYDLPPGEDFLILVEGGAGDEEFIAAPEAIRIPTGESLASVEFRATRGVKLHEVQFEVSAVCWDIDSLPSLDGTEPPPEFTERRGISGHGGHSTFVVEEAERGVPVAAPVLDGSAYVARLPEGRYTARVGWHQRHVLPEGLVSFHRTPHGGLAVPFEVTADGAPTVIVEVGPGGILEITNRATCEARLAVIDPGGVRHRLTRGEWGDYGGRDVTDRYPAGTTTRSDPVPAGPWRLVGTLGARDIDRSIEVVDGQILRIILE